MAQPERIERARALAEQARQALAILLEGFGAAAARARRLRAATPVSIWDTASGDPEHLLQGLVNAVVRLRFLLLAEDRQQAAWVRPDMGLRALHRQLEDSTADLSSQHQAWLTICELFRSVRGHGSAGPLFVAVQQTRLFDPDAFPFLEGRSGDDATSAQTIDDETVRRLLHTLTHLDGEPLDHAAVGLEHLGSAYETLISQRLTPAPIGDAPAWWKLEPSDRRRRMGAHYTPRSLSRPIVERGLEPLLRCLGERPSSEAIASLIVCDPAMGGGAFLLEACSALADKLHDAWHAEGTLDAEPRRDSRMEARRRVASRCLHGADTDPVAVELAKLSLWLLVGDTSLPWTFADRTLRCGNALVGLSLEQLRAFHWLGGPALADLQPLFDDGHRAADARLLGDLVIGAYFAASGNPAREQERQRRLGLVRRWLEGDHAVRSELAALQADLRARTKTLHWPLEHPELFQVDRPDPLDPSRRVRGVDAIIGNPPFLGGKRISTEHGDAFADWLRQIHGASKNVDLAAHFFRRADTLIASRGTTSLIATNTLAEGDTRRDGLRYLLAESGQRIYDAVRSRPWPGEAAVHVAVVHLAKGLPSTCLPVRLDGREVARVSSRLRAMREHPEAQPLAQSRGLCFIGCFLRGKGFVLSADEAAPLRERGDNGLRLKPFLGGEEVNTSPEQMFNRYVIDFDDLPLEQAEAWPELLAILRERVLPMRAKLKDRGIDLGHKRRWWQFANPRPELRAALAGLPRCLVAPRVTKHLTFAFQPTDRVFSDQLCVFALDGYDSFALLQSRVHESWARLHSSTLGEGLRYTPSDSVETFVAPHPWRRRHAPLHLVGEQLYRRRAHHLLASGRGLTQLYNQLGDPAQQTDAVTELRRLHEAVDRATLDAYGFDDLPVPPFCPTSDTEQARLEAFRDEVVERLYELNLRTAEGERTSS